MQRLAGFAAALSAALLMGACASLPPLPPRPEVKAFDQPQATALGQLAAAVAPSPAVSGFRLLVSGEEAFGSLAALIDQAQRSLDLQYYLVHSDGSSRALMRRVHAAAERGVRVRLLVDDLNTAGQDEGWLRLTAHPQIEVRVYNPFPAGRMATVSRVMASLTDIARINQRMHNKMLVADNALAITGGRNLGDAYFVRSETSNFLDMDLLVAGPAVRQLSRTFDAFWNSPLAYPIGVLAPGAAADAASSPPQAAAVPSGPAGSAAAPEATVPRVPLAQAVARRELPLVWAGAQVLADRPGKIDAAAGAPPQDPMVDDVAGLMRGARREVMLISPYFVPGPRGLALVRELRGRGVRVRILTNSLATTDAPAVHMGYARYREALLEQGVELFELAPHLPAGQGPSTRAFGSSQASLHAKVLVVDGTVAVVGSMNMDPRSEKLNTEMGVVVRSPQIAQQLLKTFDEVSANGYRLELAAGRRLRWHPPGSGQAPLSSEPEASLWLRMGVALLSAFAPEEML